MFVLIFIVFNFYSKLESKFKFFFKFIIFKLDIIVLFELGLDFVSVEVKFFQRKFVEMEIDVQEFNLKLLEIVRYKKFGSKKFEDEIDFR